MDRTRFTKKILGLCAAVLVAVAAVAAGATLQSDRPAGADAVFPELLLTNSEVATLNADAVDGASAAQTAALSDGVVTAAEYRSAVVDTQACLEEAIRADAADAGSDVEVTMGQPTLSGDGFEYTYDYEVRPANGGVGLTDEEMEEATAVDSSIDRACQQAHVHSLEVVYKTRLRSSPGYIHDAADGLVTCLDSEAGIPRAELEAATSAAQVFSIAVESSRDKLEAAKCIANAPSLGAALVE